MYEVKGFYWLRFCRKTMLFLSHNHYGLASRGQSCETFCETFLVPIGKTLPNDYQYVVRPVAPDRPIEIRPKKHVRWSWGLLLNWGRNVWQKHWQNWPRTDHVLLARVIGNNFTNTDIRGKFSCLLGLCVISKQLTNYSLSCKSSLIL